jgi:hydrogenase expression/formation protein HypC
MCLAVPGKIIAIGDGSSPTARSGTVDFQGNRAETSLVLTPEAREGDWVLVHAGFAIQVLDESDALETWKYLKATYAGDSFESEGPAEP